MDIRGIWKVKKIRVPTPDGETVFTPDNPPADERFEGSAELMQCRTEFAEDGVLNTLMFVPEDMREEVPSTGRLSARTAMPLLKARYGRKRTERSTMTRRSRVKSSGSRSIPSRRFPSLRMAVCCMASG